VSQDGSPVVFRVKQDTLTMIFVFSSFKNIFEISDLGM
jgi:hypothetical protein